MKASDADLIAAYSDLGSIYAVAGRFDMGPQTVHGRLKRLGIKCDGNGRQWTTEEDAILSAEYERYRSAGQIRLLAEKLGRSYGTVATRASELGLSSIKGPRSWGAHKMADEKIARKVFEKFKRGTKTTLIAFCRREKIDDDAMRKHIGQRWPDEWDAVIESKAPATSKYKLGRAFEYRVRDRFKKAGYFVLRSPRSGSPTDLIALKKGRVVLVQCKRSGVIVSRDWNEIYDLALSVGAIPVLAEMPGARGLVLWEMTGRKDGIKRAQPRREFDLEALPLFQEIIP